LPGLYELKFSSRLSSTSPLKEAPVSDSEESSAMVGSDDLSRSDEFLRSKLPRGRGLRD